MPLIDIQVMEDVFDEDEKKEIIKEVLLGFGRAAGRTMAENSSVRIHEIKSGAWGSLGGVWTPERARALKAQG